MACLLDVVAHRDDYVAETLPEAQEWLPVQRKADGQRFVGQIISRRSHAQAAPSGGGGRGGRGGTDGSGQPWLDSLLASGHLNGRADLPGGDTFHDALQRLLSHENLVSIQAFAAVQNPGSTAAEALAVALWDWCDAGTLDGLLQDLPLMARTGLYRGAAGSLDQGTTHLPESLCWHVVRSVLRALAWLHDGGQLQEDWMPVLHNAVLPANIFFQHPRGRETYGTCKLGNYSKCFVSGHITGPHTRKSLAMEPPFAIAASQQNNSTVPLFTDRLLTRGTDIGALGEVLHHMMAGQPWMSAHDKSNRQRYNARLKELMQQLEKDAAEDRDAAEDGNEGYTRHLKTLRRDLLRFTDDQGYHAGAGIAATLLQQSQRGFEAWCSSTADGQQYVDISEGS